MKKETKTLFDAMNSIDDDLLEQAQSFQPKKKIFTLYSKWGALAACLALTIVIGTTAYATGLTDALAAYFRTGDTPVTDAISTVGASIANDDMELRIDGAVADQRTCHMLVSFIARNEETENLFAKGDLSVQEEFSLAVQTTNGERIDILDWESATYTEPDSLGKTRSKSMFDDADMTYMISYRLDEAGVRMSEVDTLFFAYNDLALSLDIQDSIYPEYTLQAAYPDDTTFTAFSASCIGFYLTAPVNDGLNDPVIEQIALIRSDGSVLSEEEMLEIGYSSGYEYNTDDETATEFDVTGRWGSGASIRIIDLNAYCGIQVNGMQYFFVDKPAAATGTQTQFG